MKMLKNLKKMVFSKIARFMKNKTQMRQRHIFSCSQSVQTKEITLKIIKNREEITQVLI